MADGNNKYVIDLWDIEKERPIKGPLREFTSGK